MNDIYDALDFIGDADTKTLDTLSEAIRSRRKSLGHMAALANVAEIQPGDRVKTHGLSPKYLNNLTGTVLELTGTKITVEFDDTPAARRGRARFGPTPRVPAACLTKVD